MPYTPSGFFCDRLIRERERRDGEGSLNKPIRFSGQDYNTLKQESIQKKALFEDESFPATVDSLGFKELGHKSNKVKNIVWKRPKVGGRGPMSVWLDWDYSEWDVEMAHGMDEAAQLMGLH